MTLLNTVDNSKINASVSALTNAELTAIKKNRQFRFDWSKYKGHELYKITRDDNPEILGLMCLEDGGDEYKAIKIELLEVGEVNVGSGKQIDRIAGCLIAFACRRSILAGHQGWVCLIPKTDLINHYQTQYGFIPAGRYLALNTAAAIELMKQYL